MAKSKWWLIILIIVIIGGLGTYFYVTDFSFTRVSPKDQEQGKEKETAEEDKPKETTSQIKEENKETTVSINAVGDCTLGSDPKFGYAGTFIEMYDQKGPAYFFAGVKDLFASDDLTIANLETTLTTSEDKQEKQFNFKAPQEYSEILKLGNVDAVNIANNHTFDFGQSGYDDTLTTLKNSEINYFGYENYYIYTKDDLKIGLAGFYTNYDPNWQSKVDKAISDLKAQGVDAIIMSFHWGVESTYHQNASQEEIAHYAIDHGVDLVLGHHPHVLQGMELYNGKYIVYSMGNFAYGGHRNPTDKDTMIFHIDYTFVNKQIQKSQIKVYPASVSSVTSRNDFQPTILTGTEGQRVLQKIARYSPTVNLMD